ncbi:MAG: iron-containing alcohol dehydrogenase [Syntrophobacteraceae bacterium]
MSGYDSLQKFEVPEIIHGLGSLGFAGQCAKRLGGERVLLVTDPGIIDAGWVDEAIGSLKAEGLKYVVYDNVVTNPRDFHVEEGARVYEKEECDVIVAIGGGSPIDTGKGIAILVSNHGSIHDYEGCNLVTQPVPPMVCIPTTAGTGADVTQMAVVTNSRKRMKMLILGRAIMPEISLIDPRLLQTESAELIAATGMDTLSHAVEAYVSSLSWTLTDPHAIHAIELVSEHLVNATRYKDIKSLEGMSIACLEAGIAFSNAILGAVHALAHPLGGIYDIHHGIANAILLPTVVRRNMEYSLEKYGQIARAMGVDIQGMSPETAAWSALPAISKLIEDLELPVRLSQLYVNPDDISLLAELAKDDICMRTNPYCYSKAEIETLYREAL